MDRNGTRNRLRTSITPIGTKAGSAVWLTAVALCVTTTSAMAARADEPVLVDMDPAMNHALVQLLHQAHRKPHEAWKGPGRQGPRAVLAYRLGQFACETRPCWYHQFSLMLYPIAMGDPETAAWKMIRFGIGIEGGGERSQTLGHWWQRHHHLAAVLSLGAQYPARVTPWIDFVVTLGAVHRNLYGKDLFNFAYSTGLEVGAAWFVAGPFNVNASVGWRHWVVNAKPDIGYDTITITAGLGI
ncbi:MAG: hypothetical protein J7M25_15585 [Deltaproteobacteria bacterium]|nr:hypothetical protein [Deltaproteobacteria bacterium]